MFCGGDDSVATEALTTVVANHPLKAAVQVTVSSTSSVMYNSAFLDRSYCDGVMVFQLRRRIDQHVPSFPSAIPGVPVVAISCVRAGVDDWEFCIFACRLMVAAHRGDMGILSSGQRPPLYSF